MYESIEEEEEGTDDDGGGGDGGENDDGKFLVDSFDIVERESRSYELDVGRDS